MTSPVDVANMSLDQIGARFSITSLSPPLPAPNATVVARHYGPKIDALHRAAHWNCTRAQTTLTVIRAALGTPENPNGTTLPIPPVPWLYEYAYPADCLKARYLIPNPPQTAVNGLPVLGGGGFPPPLWTPPTGWKFAVATDLDPNAPNDPNARIKVILSDLEYASLVYTARIVNPDLWDPHFLAAACSTLAAWLVNPLARNAEVLKEQINIASGIILQARVSDGNEGVTTVDHMPDWMAVRGFAGFDRVLEPQSWYGWDAIGFPGGMLV